MKRWPLFLALSFLLCSLFLYPLAYAASSVGFESYQFSPSKIYQGDSNVHVDLAIINNGNSSILLHGAFVHFDWQTTDENFMVGSQGSGQAWDLGKELAPTEEFTMRITFSVPTSVSEGGHSFFFRVFYNNGLSDQWNPRAEDPFAELHIYNLYEPLYESLLITIEDKLWAANGYGFINPEAKSSLQRAETYLDDAYSYAQQEAWQSAVSRLQSTSAFVDRAYAAEQTFRTYLIIAGAFGIGAVIGAVLFIRRRKRSSKLTSRKAAEPSKIERKRK